MRGTGKVNFEALITKLYDAALDSTQMAIAMESVASSLDATTFLLQVRDAQTGTITVLSSAGFSEVHLAQYGPYYSKLDLWADHIKWLPVNIAYICSSLVPEKTFVNSEIWNEYGRNIGPGVFRAIGAKVALDDNQLALVGFHRRKNSLEFARNDSELLNRLMPHMQRALQVRTRLNASLQRETIIYEATEMLMVPLVVVRADATVVHANAAARALAAQKDGFDLGGAVAGISSAHGHESRALRALIAKAALTTAGDGVSAGGALNLSRPSKRGAYRVLVSPLTLRSTGGRAVALLAIIDPEHLPTPTPVVLAQLFGLTAAEVRLSLVLASGASLAEAAQQLGLSFQTVRTQLRSIFSKTQTSRQAELMRVLSSVSIVSN